MRAPSRDEPITIACGIPRSGTSLVMQMLEAAGLPILRDDARKPDAFNPHGYYELEAVKATARDPAWVEQAPGHAVKVIHSLLPHLPRDRRYRIVLVERDPVEVVRSQSRMLGNGKETISQVRLAEIFVAQLRETRSLLDSSDAFEWMTIRHRALLERPETVAREIAAFLARPERAEAMAAVVDPALHRERSERQAQ